MRSYSDWGLLALKTLRSLLDAESNLEVIHEGGHLWKAHFTFGTPATREAIEETKRQLQVSFPASYEQFLLYCDGAVLYYDTEYSQWGFQLYGTKDLFSINAERREPYENEWPSHYLIFGTSRGDSDLLVIDTAHKSDEEGHYPVIDGDSGYSPSEWVVIAPDFGTWLDRLVVAQGTKYWRWYP
jgi:hypothetical protein